MKQVDKKVDINDHEATVISEALFQRHSAYMNPGEFFEIEGFHSKREVYVKLTFRNHDDSLYYPVECKFDPATTNLKPTEAHELCLDFVDYYFSRYLREDRDIYLPIDWAEMQFDDVVMLAKGQVINLKLEQMADAILAQAQIENTSQEKNSDEEN